MRKMVYDHQKTTDFNVLHICKSNIDFNCYKDLHPAIVNWGIYGNDFSSTKGRRAFLVTVLFWDSRTGTSPGHRDRGRNL